MTFRWPFVARSLLERVEQARATETRMMVERDVMQQKLLAAVTQAKDELRADLLSERLRTAKLTIAIMRLKRDGAVTLPPSSRLIDRQQAKGNAHRELDPIEKAIDDNPRSRRPGVAAQLLKWARQEQRKEGVRQEDIIEQLRNWGDPTIDDADTDEADRL